MERESEFTDVSSVIHTGPAKVCCVILAADNNNADCQVYDGESSNGKQKTHLEALSGTTFGWGPGVGVTFHNGIYVVCSSTAAKVTVTYEPLARKA